MVRSRRECTNTNTEQVTTNEQDQGYASSAVSRKAVLRKCKGRFRRHNFALCDELRKDAPSKSLNVHMSGYVNVNVKRYFGSRWCTIARYKERSFGMIWLKDYSDRGASKEPINPLDLVKDLSVSLMKCNPSDLGPMNSLWLSLVTLMNRLTWHSSVSLMNRDQSE